MYDVHEERVATGGPDVLEERRLQRLRAFREEAVRRWVRFVEVQGDVPRFYNRGLGRGVVYHGERVVWTPFPIRGRRRCAVLDAE